MSVSPIDISCWDDIIGLSKTTCECFPENNYNESLSGLYLDELPGMNLSSILGTANCNDSYNIWYIMATARDNAIIQFINDANTHILKKNKVKRMPFYGELGRQRFQLSKNINSTYGGVRWFCADIVSGFVYINKIGTLFEKTGTIQLSIYNNLNELITTLTLNTTANKYNENVLSTPLELPLHSNEVDNLQYFFVYHYDPTNKPKDNQLGGCCGGFREVWDINNPYFKKYRSNTNKQHGWANYFMTGGYQTNDLTKFDQTDTVVSDTFMNGLTFGLTIQCKVNEVLCMNQLDFVANPLAVTQALLIRYKAGQILIERILSSEQINRYTMMNTENLIALSQTYIAEYNNLMENYFIPKIDISANDCYECDSIIKMAKGGLFC